MLGNIQFAAGRQRAIAELADSELRRLQDQNETLAFYTEDKLQNAGMGQTDCVSPRDAPAATTNGFSTVLNQ